MTDWLSELQRVDADAFCARMVADTQTDEYLRRIDLRLLDFAQWIVDNREAIEAWRLRRIDEHNRPILCEIARLDWSMGRLYRVGLLRRADLAPAMRARAELCGMLRVA